MGNHPQYIRLSLHYNQQLTGPAPFAPRTLENATLNLENAMFHHPVHH